MLEKKKTRTANVQQLRRRYKAGTEKIFSVSGDNQRRSQETEKGSGVWGLIWVRVKKLVPVGGKYKME